jgi:hypothetical protein
VTKTYKGPLAWLFRWNFRRVEHRRWLRHLNEAIPADHASIMEALTFQLERSAVEAKERAAWQASVNQRLELLSGQLGALADQVAALDDKPPVDREQR